MPLYEPPRIMMCFFDDESGFSIIATGGSEYAKEEVVEPWVGPRYGEQESEYTT